MADRDLEDMGHRRAEGRKVLQIEIVACVDAHPEGVGLVRGLDVDGERALRLGLAPFERPRKRLGVKLDTVGP